MSGKARISSSSYSRVAGLRPATMSQKTQSAMRAERGSAQLARRRHSELQAHARQLGVELAAPGALEEALQGLLLAERTLVRALRAEGVVDVDDRHEPREERHLLAPEAIRVSVPVPPLVVV